MQPTLEPEDLTPADTGSHNTRRAWRVRGILSKKEASLKFLDGHRIKVCTVDPHTKIFAVCHRSEANSLHDAILRKKLFGRWSRKNSVRAQLRYYDKGYWERPKRTRVRKESEND